MELKIFYKYFFGLMVVFHYIPLHQAPYWKGEYDHIDLPITIKTSETLLRLPLFYGIKKEEIKFTVEKIKKYLQII